MLEILLPSPLNNLKSQYSDQSEFPWISPIEGPDIVGAGAVGVVVATAAVLDLDHAGIQVVPPEGGLADVNLEEYVAFDLRRLDAQGSPKEWFPGCMN